MALAGVSRAGQWINRTQPASTISSVANVSYLRTAVDGRAQARPGGDGSVSRRRLRPPGRYILGAVGLLVVGLLAVGALTVSASHASLSADSRAIAKIGLPLGGGQVQSATVVSGPHSRPVPVEIRGGKIWPRGLIGAGQALSLDVVVRRPGWIAWLAGSTETLHLTITAPAASLRTHYLTVASGAPLRLRFRQPIAVFWIGSAGHLRRHILSSPQSVVTIAHSSEAGTIFVAAAPRLWERARQSMVDWFPAGGTTSAVATPAPGQAIKPDTPITVTFSKPVSSALGSHRPPISPATQGSWHTTDSHTIVFVPRGYGYGLGAKVQLALPSGVRLLGGQQSASSAVGDWKVPAGSTVRLQQMLALLGYLPLRFRYAGAGVGLTPADQETAAVKPPAGRFTWRYSNTPAALKGFWQAGSYGQVTRGALMAFENDHGLSADGVAGPQVWQALIGAVLHSRGSSFGYTFVSVDVASQSLTLWHNGRDVISGTPVNTGIASAPTATGTYPVYEHLPVTTMSGTNPDGSHYSDPGIPDVSYFNGGDALHGFTRAQYGSPQSLGCVEMPFDVAAHVYPYTPIGTLVHVS